MSADFFPGGGGSPNVGVDYECLHSRRTIVRRSSFMWWLMATTSTKRSTMICSHSPDVLAGSEFDAVMHLQAALKFPHIKQEDPLFHLRDLGVQTLPPREVGWLQDEIGGQFRDGRTFQDLIDDLKEGRVNALEHPRMEINVFDVLSMPTSRTIPR